MSGFIQVGSNDEPVSPRMSSSTFRSLLDQGSLLIDRNDEEALDALKVAVYGSALLLTDELASRDLQQRVVRACRRAIPAVRKGIQDSFAGADLAEQLQSIDGVADYLDRVAQERGWSDP